MIIEFKSLLSVTVLSLFAFAPYAQAKCTPDFEKTTVSWIGYKTDKKVGVKGNFPNFKINGIPGKKIEDYLKTASFSIDASKVESGNIARDMKIAKFFFGNFMRGAHITGFVKKMEDGVVTTTVNMNDVTKDIPLKMSRKKNEVTLTGSVNFMDFVIKKPYEAIAKACEIKHKGKTWAEAGIEIKSKFTGDC